MEDLSTPPGGIDSEARDINENGEVVGVGKLLRPG